MSVTDKLSVTKLNNIKVSKTCKQKKQNASFVAVEQEDSSDISRRVAFKQTANCGRVNS